MSKKILIGEYILKEAIRISGFLSWMTIDCIHKKYVKTDYEFTTLKSPNAQYRYFRLFVKSNEKPNLMKAGIILEESTRVKVKDILRHT